MNYPRNPRFHQSEQASESALASRNTDDSEKRLAGADVLPIILLRPREDYLTKEMWKLYESLLPTQESHDKRVLFANKIEEILNREWPGKDIKVHMFGSSMNELGTTQSDVDLCVTTKCDDLMDMFVLSKSLENNGMKIEQIVHKAKVPIVRLFDSKLDLACDINVNNTLALHNTRLIGKYVSIDSRVRPLAMVVKHWARRRALNDAAKGGTISTYTWTCIILNFLQMRNPPILPVLHKLPHEGVDPIMVNGEDASFYEKVENLSQFGSKNRETLGGLLFAFFRRMAFEFDYDNHVISLRQGKYLTKAEKGWDTCKGWKMLCIEEPFNTTRNLGNSADDISVNGLREEFRRAYDILYDKSVSFDKLYEEYIFPNQYINYNNNYNNYNYNNNNYYQNRGFNNKRIYYKRNHNNNKTNGTWSGGKSNGRKCYSKFYQYTCLNNTTDNFHDINGKNNYSQDQDDEEDGSSMRRFDNISLRQGDHYNESEESVVVPASEYYSNHYHDNNNDVSARKQFDNIQAQNKRQIQHNIPKEDPQMRQKTNLYPIKKKNDDHQFHNYGQFHDSHSSICKNREEEFARHADTTSNQNQFIYKNNHQKAENNSYNKNSRSHSVSRSQNSLYSDQKSNYLQHTNTSYDSDNKYNNGFSRRPNTPSDSNQKASATYSFNQGRTYYKSNLNNKHGYNSRQVEEQTIDDLPSNPNFDRSNPVQMSSPKPGHKPYNNNNNNKSRKHTQSRQKSAENAGFNNNPYPYIPPSNDSIYTGFQGHKQSNDVSANYQRRMSHQSSSDGSNSQTSGNTSITSNTSNNSNSNTSNFIIKNDFQKSNGNSNFIIKNDFQRSNGNQNNYYQQQNQNKSNNNGNGGLNNNRKRKFNNNNNNNYMNGYNNSGNGNFRLNNTTNNSPSINYNDPNFQEVAYNTSSQMNQGQGHYVNDYSGNSDINGYRAHNGSNGSYNTNIKNHNNNSNNNSNWRNSKIINYNGNNTNNGPRSANSGNNFSNRNTNSNNSNNNYQRSNVNNNSSNHYSKNQTNNSNNNNNANSHKSVNGNNNYKSFDGNNHSNMQTTKNLNNNNYSTKNGGNNQIYNGKKNNRKGNRNSFKAENKEDGVNYQQQYLQEASLQERQNHHHNTQTHQQKKYVQNGQNNNNSGKGKGNYKKFSNSHHKQNAEC